MREWLGRDVIGDYYKDEVCLVDFGFFFLPCTGSYMACRTRWCAGSSPLCYIITWVRTRVLCSIIQPRFCRIPALGCTRIIEMIDDSKTADIRSTYPSRKYSMSSSYETTYASSEFTNPLCLRRDNFEPETDGRDVSSLSRRCSPSSRPLSERGTFTCA